MTWISGLPDVIVGRSQSFPAKLPEVIVLELSKIRTVQTMSLSATGSKNAPKGECEPCIFISVINILPEKLPQCYKAEKQSSNCLNFHINTVQLFTTRTSVLGSRTFIETPHFLHYIDSACILQALQFEWFWQSLLNTYILGKFHCTSLLKYLIGFAS